MKLVRSNKLVFVPASHEDPKNPGVFKKVLLKKGDVQSGVVEMVNWAKLPKNKSFNSHLHEDMEEVFIIISGSVEASIGEEKTTLNSGDTLVVPINTPHSFKNKSNTTVEYIVFGVSKNTGGSTITLK